ncbi:MAG TPA: hypothetical protein VMG11_05070 [Steroidobacteraceae bacterium]|nr:hypothetical protein [Steroidobacteraceae bacterium]
MRLLDSTILLFQPGLGRRLLKEQLHERNVKIPLSEGCLRELVNDAVEAAERLVSAAAGAQRYLTSLKEQLALRAEFVSLWTASDELVDSEEGGRQALVRIARKYALPRPWKLSEPVAAACPRPQPSYWKWASGGTGVIAQP